MPLPLPIAIIAGLSFLAATVFGGDDDAKKSKTKKDKKQEKTPKSKPVGFQGKPAPAKKEPKAAKPKPAAKKPVEKKKPKPDDSSKE